MFDAVLVLIFVCCPSLSTSPVPVLSLSSTNFVSIVTLSQCTTSDEQWSEKLYWQPNSVCCLNSNLTVVLFKFWSRTFRRRNPSAQIVWFWSVGALFVWNMLMLGESTVQSPSKMMADPCQLWISFGNGTMWTSAQSIIQCMNDVVGVTILAWKLRLRECDQRCCSLTMAAKGESKWKKFIARPRLRRCWTQHIAPLAMRYLLTKSCVICSGTDLRSAILTAGLLMEKVWIC